MVRVGGQVHIARPPEVVFDVVADERNRYDPSIRHAELLTEGPIGVGTRFRSVAGSEKRPVEMTIEVTGYDRPRRLATITRLSWMDIHSTLDFRPDGAAGTRMRWRSELRPHGAFRILTPLLAAVGRRQTSRIWAALEERMR